MLARAATFVSASTSRIATRTIFRRTPPSPAPHSGSSAGSATRSAHKHARRMSETAPTAAASAAATVPAGAQSQSPVGVVAVPLGPGTASPGTEAASTVQAVSVSAPPAPLSTAAAGGEGAGAGSVRASAAPKRTASQRMRSSAEVASNGTVDAAAAAPMDAEGDENKDADEVILAPIPGFSAGLAKAPERPDEAEAAVAVEEPETPRKRQRRSSTKATEAATASPSAAKSPGRRKKGAAATPDVASPSAAAVGAAAAVAEPAATPAKPLRKPRMSRAKSAPAPDVAMEDADGVVEGTAVAAAATAAAPSADLPPTSAVKAKKAPARSQSNAGGGSSGKKKKISAAAAAADGDGEGLLSRSQSLGSMGGSQEDGDEGGGVSFATASATKLLVIEKAKREARPAGSTTIMCWNVNGLRAALRNGAASYFDEQDADIIALCEVKADSDTVKREFGELGEPVTGAAAAASGSGVASSPLAAAFAGKKPAPAKYHRFFNCCTTKKGYSGTAILSKVQPIAVTYGINNKEHDSEGRVITAEYASFFLVVSYVPNAGQKLERLSYRTTEWDAAMLAHLQALKARGKEVIWTGDLNVAFHDKDIHNPKTNQKSAGFTPAERANFGALVSTHGFVDVFEHLYPDQIERWTYFGHRQNNRAKNKGWRLDYFVASSAEFVKNNVHDTWIGSELSQGDKGTRRSDHLPIFLCLKPAV